MMNFIVNKYIQIKCKLFRYYHSWTEPQRSMFVIVNVRVHWTNEQKHWQNRWRMEIICIRMVSKSPQILFTTDCAWKTSPLPEIKFERFATLFIRYEYAINHFRNFPVQPHTNSFMIDPSLALFYDIKQQRMPIYYLQQLTFFLISFIRMLYCCPMFVHLLLQLATQS